MSFHIGSPNNTYNRRGGGGGGGRRMSNNNGGGNYNNNNNNNNNNGGGYRSPMGGAPMPTPEDDIKNKLTSLIVRIGDKTSSALESNIEGLVGVLLPDLENNRSTIISILFKCISQLPYKTPIYATIIGKMNQKNADFGKDICIQLIKEINQTLKEQRFYQARLLIRFVGTLVNTGVVALSSMFTVFDSLLAILQTEYTQIKSDYYVFLVLTTIPWVGLSLSGESTLVQLNTLFEELEGYMEGRNHTEKKFFQAFAENEDQLEVLTKHIKLQREDGWNCESIIQIHKSFDFSDSTRHELDSIVIPDPESKFDYPTYTRPVFRIFDETADGELKPIDRYIIEEYIVDILYFFNSSHKEAAKFIYSLPIKGEIDHIVVETILSEALKLPKPEFKSIYYSVMFVDLFKDQHQTIIPVFAYSMNTLFENLDHLDTEVIDRFSLMFAHHLSNFEYKWVWADWAVCLTAPVSGDPASDLLVQLQKKFIIQLLESITRLSYLDKIKNSLPIDYHPYLPQLPNANFKFFKQNNPSEESREMITQSHKLLLLFKTKEPVDSIINHVSSIPVDSGVDVVELVTKCILQIGSTSFSHLTYAIERYVTLFKSILRTSDDRLKCVKATTEFWESSHQHTVIVIDKLTTYKILLPIDPINWYLLHDPSRDITSMYIWEIIQNSIEKTMIVLSTLTKDLSDLVNNPSSSISEKTETELKLQSVQQEQQSLFSAIFRGLSNMLKNPLVNNNPVNSKILAGHLKSIARKHFSQVKSLLESQPQLLTIINEYAV